MSYVDIACRAVLALTFAAAVWGKVRDHARWTAFRSSLTAFLRSNRRAHVVAVVVVTAEAGAAVSQLSPFRWMGYGLAFGLLAAFSGFVVLVLRRRLGLACNCFGRSSPVRGRHLARNGLLLLITTVGLTAAVVGESGVHPAGLAMSLGTAFCLAIAIVRFDDVVEILP
ncbi:MauE/DoxX family redox-associated membrane protein [Micromonospora sp. NPDC048898]|uniref:MauE/DoxX family redox-associated membrane protein n=1 Tax=Micromonospora sp. NPDC048898 TaxID=3364260 RepID=UPI003722D125